MGKITTTHTMVCPLCSLTVPIAYWQDNNDANNIACYCSDEWSTEHAPSVIHECNDRWVRKLFNADVDGDIRCTDVSEFENTVKAYWDNYGMNYIMDDF